MGFIRPFGDILQWDENACEAACAAQLMHIVGKLRLPINTSNFDRRIGRKPGGFDETAGCFKLLLANGFRIDVWNTGSYEDALNSQRFRAMLRGRNMTAGAIDEYMRSSYPLMRRRIQSFMVLTRHPWFNVRVVQETTATQLQSLVDGRRVIGANLHGDDEISHQVLLRHTNKPGVTTLYDPAFGTMDYKLAAIAKHLIGKESGLIAFTAPK